MSQRGKFIVFEGIDGSGKSTQIKKLLLNLRNAGICAVDTREPTDNDIGSLLRQYLTGALHTDNRAIAALFAADRIDHITCPKGISETLASGISVICDRYYFSSYAYHSIDADARWIIDLNRTAVSLAKPDLHIFIDTPAEVSMKRVKRRGKTELFEVLERQKKVRENYLRLFDYFKDTENIIIIDGTKDILDISKEIIGHVLKLYKQ